MASQVTKPSVQTVRRWIMTGAITAITVTGTIYGAQLKTGQEVKQEKRKLIEADPEEVIAHLETARQELVTKKTELERKIQKLNARQAAKQTEAGKDVK